MFASASGSFGDPNAYRAIFFEETQDHLASVESILLKLVPGAPCHDELNAIFRAVHSIKGSAAMLGYADMAALAHLSENLLDVLRKNERPVDASDVAAMLRACDTLQGQAMCHRGVLETAPEAAPAEALLREQLALPRGGVRPSAHGGDPRRRFRVQLSPLAQPIPDDELDMMFDGLADMGEVHATDVRNEAGGSVAFEVALEGTAFDLRSVLALLVAPELITVEELAAATVPVAVPVTTPAPVAVVNADHDEWFVDPEEFRRKREALAAATTGSPEQELLPPAGAVGEGGTPAEPLPESTHEFEFFTAPPARKSEPVVTAAAVTAPAIPAPAAAAPAADAFDPLLSASAATQSAYIRVATEKIDLLVNLVGELVITEAMLARSQAAIQDGQGTDRFAENGLADLARHTRNLQEAVLAIRMLPIANVFSRFPRLVHELSARLGKKVDLRFQGETTELDRGLIEKISDPLTHLVRNAIDHGLETPEVREAAGKPPVGHLRLRASQRGGNVIIEVSDDGRGLDRERILARAQERGIRIADDAPDHEVWALIFEAGFSTAEHVTELSGRGVGMDVVRRNIQALGGTVDLRSSPGQGTTVLVSVPLTLAIMDAMTIAIGGETYVLPLATVVESLSIEPGQLHTLPGQNDTLRVREDFLPVIHLAQVFPPQKGKGERGGIAVIVEADGNYAALVVDELVGQQQVVVKSLETNFRKVPGLSGATVMGDGSVALILDVSHIVRSAGRHYAMAF